LATQTEYAHEVDEQNNDKINCYVNQIQLTTYQLSEVSSRIAGALRWQDIFYALHVLGSTVLQLIKLLVWPLL
jgi:hypothetical protein